MDSYPVTVGAGTLRPLAGLFEASHSWTPGGVAVESRFTGAHLLHVAVAGGVLDDVYREASTRGVRLEGVRVRAEGGFDEEGVSTGIRYRIEVDSNVSPDQLAELIAEVDRMAPIPGQLRAGVRVERVG
jgi:uncharacterized OsmC-like protein